MLAHMYCLSGKYMASFCAVVNLEPNCLAHTPKDLVASG